MPFFLILPHMHLLPFLSTFTQMLKQIAVPKYPPKSIL